MRTLPFWLILSCAKPSAPEPAAPEPQAESPVRDARTFAAQADERLLELWIASETAHWEHETDLTEAKEAEASAAEEAVMAYLSETIPTAAQLIDGAEDPESKRLLHLLRLATHLPAPSDPELRAELAAISTRMSSAYGKGKWCRGEDDCLTIGDITEILTTSRDPEELRAAWEGWHTVGAPMRADYQRFVELGNTGATEIGFGDLGQLWRNGYDMSPAELEAEITRLWDQVRPLYEELHCFVRSALSEQYGAEVVPDDGLIPTHLLGNLWAQDWSALYPVLEPHPDQPSLDVGASLKGKPAEEMVRLSEGFFVSMGLDPLPETFWERSMLVKPPDREVVCHASAWDPTWSDDLRIKMCIVPTHDDLVTIHHELGHLYYFHYYRDLPALFRQGAHDGFHEAIGDAIALSVTPSYLHEIGLLEEASDSPEAVINAQMQTALARIAFLPFGLLVDRWRWEVFDGRIPPEAYNAGWWRLKAELQGVAPPSERGEEHFDPGAKYHVPANTPYLRYFLAHVLQFQLHRSMCEAAGHEGPLHTCSVYGSTEAGDQLQALLELGASQPWPEVLEAATGERQMDASALVAYFEPLMGWLEEQNEGRTCGW